MNLKENAGCTLMLDKAPISVSLSLATSLKAIHKRNNNESTTDSILRPLVTQKVIHVRGARGGELWTVAWAFGGGQGRGLGQGLGRGDGGLDQGTCGRSG